METISIFLQIVIALGVINVWILRFNKGSSWRGGKARNMKEEFKIYGLPGWFVGVIGFLKLLFATALLAGIWYPVLVAPAAIGMGILMIGAIGMHIKIKDQLKKSVPAFTMLVMSVLVYLF